MDPSLSSLRFTSKAILGDLQAQDFSAASTEAPLSARLLLTARRMRTTPSPASSSGPLFVPCQYGLLSSFEKFTKTASSSGSHTTRGSRAPWQSS